jgi:hypothetical protein
MTFKRVIKTQLMSGKSEVELQDRLNRFLEDIDIEDFIDLKVTEIEEGFTIIVIYKLHAEVTE